MAVLRMGRSTRARLTVEERTLHFIPTKPCMTHNHAHTHAPPTIIAPLHLLPPPLISAEKLMSCALN